MQEPTPQTMNNTFDSANTSNPSFNSKPPKKINFGLIIGIVVAVVAAVVIVVLLLGKNNSNGTLDSLVGSSGEKITEEQIKNYNLKSIARWGNISLGVSYSIPTATDTSLFSTKGSKSFSYLHGHSFVYSNGYYIYVEKSLDGNKNLKTLPLDINNEKNSDKYKYEFSSKVYNFNEITTTKEIIIGNIKTVYFESNESNESALVGTNMANVKTKYLGYSFEYNGSYYSVYGQISYKEEENQEKQKQLLKEYLHHIINSFKKYNNESFYELDHNFNLKTLLDGGEVNESDRKLLSSKRQFVINMYGSHSSNGMYGDYGRYTINLMKLDKMQLNWNGNIEDIYNAAITNEKCLIYIDFITTCGSNGEKRVCSTTDILEETKETINGIEMKKYILKHEFIGMTDYYVVYTFIVDNTPYLFQYSINYDYKESDNLTVEQQNILKDVTNIIASTLIRTIRFIEVDDNLSEWDKNYQYQNYIN